MQIEKPTYLIAELGGDVVPLVLEMRQRFNPDNQYWPADITIAGSSGVGTLKLGQDLAHVVEKFSPIIERLAFTELAFSTVERFPDTGIYYLNPERQKFDRLHQAIIGSDVEFDGM